MAIELRLTIFVKRLRREMLVEESLKQNLVLCNYDQVSHYLAKCNPVNEQSTLEV